MILLAEVDLLPTIAVLGGVMQNTWKHDAAETGHAEWVGERVDDFLIWQGTLRLNVVSAGRRLIMAVLI